MLMYWRLCWNTFIDRIKQLIQINTKNLCIFYDDMPQLKVVLKAKEIKNTRQIMI